MVFAHGGELSVLLLFALCRLRDRAYTIFDGQTTVNVSFNNLKTLIHFGINVQLDSFVDYFIGKVMV